MVFCSATVSKILANFWLALLQLLRKRQIHGGPIADPQDVKVEAPAPLGSQEMQVAQVEESQVRQEPIDDAIADPVIPAPAPAPLPSPTRVHPTASAVEQDPVSISHLPEFHDWNILAHRAEHEWEQVEPPAPIDAQPGPSVSSSARSARSRVTMGMFTPKLKLVRSVSPIREEDFDF